MIAAFIPFTLLVALLALMRWHLGIANEEGSHDPANPFVIDDPFLAQAIYGRLSATAPSAYYTFSIPDALGVRLMLLIPDRDYQSGFRARVILSGSGFSEEGMIPAMQSASLTIAGRTYRLIQTYTPPLPSAGVYRIEIRRDAGSGVYCLCLGTREGGHASAAMRARIERLLQGQ